MNDKWWICTDAFARGAKKVLGPFESQDLALTVRDYVERDPDNKRMKRTFWVDSEVSDG